MMVLLLACLAFAGCLDSPPPDRSAEFRAGLRGELGALDPGGRANGFRPFTADYMRTFGFDSLQNEGLRVVLGLVPWRSGSLGVLALAPSGPPRATVFFAHGFLSHAGEFQPVLARLVRTGFAVVAFDLPGHGFSDGELGAIADFELYGAALADLVRFIGAADPREAALPRPWHAVGHSTGASALFIYFQRFGNNAKFDRLVLLSPLLRPAHWDLSLAGLSLSGWFMRYVPHPAGEDRPLGISGFPLSWVERLRDWNASAGRYGALDSPALILQGGADDVVDFRHNLPYFQSRLPMSRTLIIEGAGHHLQTDQAFQKAFAEQVPPFLRGY